MTRGAALLLLAFAAACAQQKPAPDTTAKADTASKKIIGRDSVRQGPIVGIPTIKDTAKKRP